MLFNIKITLIRKIITFSFFVIVLLDCILPHGMHISICFCKDGKTNISIETCSSDAPYIYDSPEMDIPLTKEFSNICDINAHESDVCFGCKSNYLSAESINLHKLSQPVVSNIFFNLVSPLYKVADSSSYNKMSSVTHSALKPSIPLLI